MPSDEASSQEVLPPSPIERLGWGDIDVAEEFHAAYQQSLSWTGLDDEERLKVIECEMALTVIHKRGFDEWLKIGEGFLLFQTEVKQQSNSTSVTGKRYNLFWK